MGETNAAGAGRRYRRARRLHRNRRGLVAVVGTLLALLVFFALFGIFLTEYVPLWMTDNESQFTSQAATSFALFKSYVDQQYSLGGPPTYGTSFVISSQSVPLIAQPTGATLAFLPSTCPGLFATNGTPVHPDFCVFQSLTLSVGPGGSAAYTQRVSNGVLEMVLPNRYFSPELFYFEDDAVIQSQGSGLQVMDFPPPLNVTTVAHNTTVSGSFLQLYGNASTVVGQGSEPVYSHLRFTQTVASDGSATPISVPFSYTYSIGTLYPCAWAKWLWSTMNGTHLPTSQYNLTWRNPANGITSAFASAFPPTSVCLNTNGKTTLITLNITRVNYARIFYAGVQVVIGVGGT